MPTPKNPPDQAVLFVDLLGFKALTEAHPHALVHLELAKFRLTHSSASARVFSTFHSVLDQALFFAIHEGHMQIMIFSDCAFMVLGNPSYTANFAVKLMRSFIGAEIPVRMGMACGSFENVRVSSDSRGTSTLNRAMFFGTGIVHAHVAESQGGKGFRIFLHPSMKPHIRSINAALTVLDLPTEESAG